MKLQVEIFRGTAKIRNETPMKLNIGMNLERKKIFKPSVIVDDIFEALAEGMLKNGDEPIWNRLPKRDYQLPKYRHGVIFGYGRSLSPEPKAKVQNYRYEVLEQQRKMKGHTVCFDGGYFKSLGNYEYYRVGIDSPLGNGTFCNENSPDDRWKKIQAEYGVPWNDWRPNAGKYVTIFIQPDPGFSMGGQSTLKLLQEWVPKIRSLTDKEVVIKAHPKCHKLGQITTDIWKYAEQNNVRIFDHTVPIYQVLKDTNRAVTWNSTVAVEAVAYGIPTICFHDFCMAWDVCDHTLDAIVNPTMPDRTQWINNLHYGCWTSQELATGELWSKLREEMIKRDEARA